MDLEDFLSALDIRIIDRDLTVESARTQQRRIEDIAAVCRRNDDNAFLIGKAVHFNEELVQRLLTFIVAAAETGASVSADRVDLVDEHDRRRMLLRLLKQVTHTARTDTDEHLNKVRTGNREERHARLTCNSSCKQRFTGTGRAEQQHAARDSRTDIVILLRILEEVNDLSHFRLFLVGTCDIGKGCFLCGAACRLDIRSAERIDLAAAVCLPEHHNEQHDRHDHQQRGRYNGEHPRVIRHFEVVLRKLRIRMLCVILRTVVHGVIQEQSDIRNLVGMCFLLTLKHIFQLSGAEIECVFRHLVFIEVRKDIRILCRVLIARQIREKHPDRNDENQRNDHISQQATIFAQVSIHSFFVVSSQPP